MQPTATPNRGKLIAIAAVALVVIIGLIVFLISIFGSGSKSNATPTPGPNAEYAGLTKIGLSDPQLDELKFALYQFGKANNTTQKTVAITNVKAVPRDRHSTSRIRTINATLTYNGTAYTAKIDLTSIVGLQLYLTDPKTSKQVFDSGYIDTTQTAK